MGGTCDTDADNGEIAAAVLTIPQTINTNNLTGTIKYQYHYCDSNCNSAPCSGTMQYIGEGNTAGGYQTWFMCDRCNRQFVSGPGWDGKTWTCGQSRKICGYSNGQLIGATITY